MTCNHPINSMAPNQLQIKTNSLSRLLKEEGLYRKEVDDYLEKVKKMEDDKEDEYSIKKMREVLADTKQMIPELKDRIEQALDSLKELLETIDVEEGIEAAQEKVKEAEAYLENYKP